MSDYLKQWTVTLLFNHDLSIKIQRKGNQKIRRALHFSVVVESIKLQLTSPHSIERDRVDNNVIVLL